MTSLLALPRGSLSVYLVASVAFATQAMMAPLVPLLGVSLGASPIIIGALVSLGFALPLVLALPVGALMNRYDPAKLILLGAAGIAIAPLPLTIQPALPVLAGTQLLLGLSHLVIILAAQASIASLTFGRSRQQAFGWFTTFVSGGQLVGPLLAGALLDRTGFRVAFAAAVLVALSGLVAAVAFSRSAPTRPSESGRTSSDRPVPGPQDKLLRNAGVGISLLVSSIVLLALSTYQTFLPTHLAELDFSATAIGALLSLRALVSMLVRPFTAWVVERLSGRLITLSLSLLFVAVGLGSTGIATVEALLVLFSICIGVGAGFAQPVSMATLADHVSPERLGTALGLRTTANRLAQVSGPIALGFLATRLGFPIMFLIAGLMVLSGVALTAYLAPSFIRAENSKVSAIEATDEPSNHADLRGGRM